METTVYVVSNAWYREGSTVIGVADTLRGAQEIAERHQINEGAEIGGWSDWQEDDLAESRRDALCAEGIHPSLYQEIVAVPLTLTGVRAVIPEPVDVTVNEVARDYSNLR